MQQLISVIIPVYNVEKFLTRCIESVLAQSYRNIEILLIDDGSTDGSPDLCHKYEQIDSRIRVITKKNGGLSDARNVGIDNCHGEYITFVDSDDYIASDFIETLYKTACKFKADIVVSELMKFYGEYVDERKVNKKKNSEICFDNVEAIADMLYRKQITAYVPGKLYKRELFENIRFPVGKLFEDLFTTYKLFYTANSIVYVSVQKYYYYQRTFSIVNSSFSPNRMDQLDACDCIQQFIQDEQLPLDNAIKSKILISSIDLYRRIADKKNYRNECQRILQNINECRMDVLKDKNNKNITRIIALFAVLSPELLRIIGRIFTIMRENKIIKLTKPI